jgi:signal transduction histidine kinase/ligand-binding sensor domain-containing protein
MADLRQTGLCGVLLCTATCIAAAEQLPAVVYSARDGFHTTIPRIVVDSRGFIWFPGSEGIVRLSGSGIRVFTTADGLPAGTPVDMLERRDGRYWVTVDDHLCLYDPVKGGKRFHCEVPGIGVIRTVAEDEHGLWCGTDKGLWRRPATGQNRWEQLNVTVPATAAGSARVSRLCRDKRGDMWAASNSGLYRFRSNGRVDRWTHVQGLPTGAVTTVTELGDDIWVGTKGLVRFRIDPVTGQARIADRYTKSDGLPSDFIRDVHLWKGSVWAATLQGLARQLPSGRWDIVELQSDLRGLPVESIASDGLGNLWIGTDGNGAARIAGAGMSRFSERDGLALSQVWSIFEDRNGDLTVVTKDEGRYFLNRLDGRRFQPIRPKLPYGNGWGWSWSQIVVHSQMDEWWLATGLGLLQYRSGLQSVPKLVGPESGIQKGNVFRIFQDSRGGLWVSVMGPNRLYHRRSRQAKFQRFDSPPLLASAGEEGDLPAAFAEDRHGQIWIGMLDGGLVRYHGGTFQQFSAAAGAPDQGVRALLVDRRGRLWIGSRRRGLMRVDDPAASNPVFSSYTRTSGLSDSTVLSVVEDLKGRIYASSGRGIDRLDPDTGRIRSYTATDGLPPGEWRVGFRDRRGALWFGGHQGLIRIEPEPGQSDPPVVLVHAIRVSGMAQAISDIGEAEPGMLSLGPSQRDVEAQFDGFRHDLLYQTRLSGVDADWTPPSPLRSVRYLSLAAGSYDLSIRAVTPEGVASSQPAHVRFRIARPVWQRWWFLTLAALAAGCAAYTAHRIRLSRLLAIERLRTRIATDLHDDIGASLSEIAILSEVARQGGNGADPLGRIAGIARELVESLSDLVWAISPRRDKVDDLVRRMRQFAEDLLVAQNIDFQLTAPRSSLQLDPDLKREIFLIYKECIHNAVRHSSCRCVRTKLNMDSGWLILSIRDDGLGMSGEEIPARGGHGIANMRRRAAGLGGNLEVNSMPGKGAEFVLRVPFERRQKPRK